MVEKVEYELNEEKNNGKYGIFVS